MPLYGFVDLANRRFDRLTVLGRAGRYRSDVMWSCRCDCGNQIVARGTKLRQGRTKSCGCLWREKLLAQNAPKHGGSRERLYRIWGQIKGRCCNPNHHQFRHYGGRGVTVHATWIDDYSAFRAWAHANGYRDGLSIKRIDVNGDYEPKNCTWIPQRDQSRIDARGG